MSARASLLEDDERTIDDKPPSPTSVTAPSLAFLRESSPTASAYSNGASSSGADNGRDSSSSSDANSHHPAAAPLGLASSLSRNSRSGPFRPMKVLGRDVVVLKGVSKRYKLAGREEEVVALRSVDLTPSDRPDDTAHIGPIREGEFVMIRGPSGGGKTTLLNLLGTIDDPTSGSIEMFGHSVDSSSKDSFLADLRLNKIGFVFQTFNLLATMSAFENVELPMIMRGKLTQNQARARALELLDLVGLQDRYGHLPMTIARSLANEPELLLLDEPTGDLDSRNTVDVMDLILAINLGQLTANSTNKPTTVMMVTHNPDLECYADRILYFEDGRIKKQALNRSQRRIDYQKYNAYINSHH